MLNTATAMTTYPKRIIIQDAMTTTPFLEHPFVHALPQRLCQAADAPRPATQVMKSTRVFGENHPTCMAGKDRVTKGSCRHIGSVPTDRHQAAIGLWLLNLKENYSGVFARCHARIP